MSIESVLILGIGNTLLRDEGIGVHVMQRMRNAYGEHPCIEYLDGGTLSFTLAEPIARADGLIVVDAARMHSPPGTVKVFRSDAMVDYLSGNRQSVHEVSLTDLLDIARLTDSLPEQMCLVGIEPESLDWGGQPSDLVRLSVEPAIEEILTILADWDIHPADSN